MNLQEKTIQTLRNGKRNMRRKTNRLQRAIVCIIVLSIATHTIMYFAMRNKYERKKSDIIVESKTQEDVTEEKPKMQNEVKRNTMVTIRAIDDVIEEHVNYKSLGEFKITAYCPCRICCGEWSDGITASGTVAYPGVIAVDPSIIPLGSVVMIEGNEYRAEDTGGAIKGNRIDIFFLDHNAALDFGIQNHEVLVYDNE